MKSYTLSDFVPTTDLDEIYIEVNLEFGISYKSIFKFAVRDKSRIFRLIP